jgi:anti-sigma B factor antagonist
MTQHESGFVQVRREGAVTVMQVTGEIDLHRSPELHTTLMAVCREKPPMLVIDLAGVEYMDSSGVGTLVHAYRLVKEYGGRMVLASMTDRVRSVFEISRLDQYFRISATVEEAIAS